MKICIPTVDDLGLQGKPSDHFGSAPFFTVVDTASGNCEVIANGGHGHGGRCAPTDLIGEHGIDAVVCRGMGGPARASIVALKIDVLRAEGESVAEISALAGQGKLQALADDQACGGHHHGSMGGDHCNHG